MTKGIHTIFLLLLLSILPIASCQVEQPVLDICAEQDNSVSAVKILAIGDSRVEGRTPHSESYRYHLWRNFKLNSWDVNFLGSRLDNGEYAPVDGLCFDNEHEGISGATSSLILSRVRTFDADNVADVILLGIGGNDISNGNVRIQQIINNIQ